MTRPDLSLVPSTREDWTSEFRFSFDALVGGEKIGQILVQRGRKEPWIHLWIVEGVGVNRFFREGIGTALYEEALREAVRRGGRLASECRATVYAVAFWKKQLELGRAEILTPPRWGSEAANALIAVKPGVTDLG